MIQVGIGIIGTIVRTAAFGALAGKILDTLILSKVNRNIDKRQWLRQTKLETYSLFCDKIIFARTGSLTNDEFMDLRACATKTILLIEDKKLIQNINNYLYTSNLMYSTDENFSQNDITKLKRHGFEIIHLLNQNLKSN